MGILDDFKCPSKKLPIGGVLPAVRRIIVIGDVHGDKEQFRKVLLLAKVIDEKDNWIGKDTVVVQLGDLIDSCRGEDCLVESPLDKANDLDLIKYTVKLHQKAQKDNGAFYSLVGNHEIMNVMGHMSHVSPKNFDLFQELVDDEKHDFKNKYEARKWAFSPGNPIANFLACSRFGVLIIGSNLFVHAGLVPSFSKDYSPQQVNKIIREWLLGKIKDPIEYEKILSSKDYSPFWNRILGYLPTELNQDDKQCEIAKEALENWKVGHIHIGHTPTFIKNLGINSTCGDMVWRHDRGMSHAFRKFDKTGISEQVHVLEIINDNEFNIIREE